jgi:hypothetical protein
MRKTIQCSSYAVIGVALLLVGVQTAWAHTDPPEPNNPTATGITISLKAFRADGVTPVLPGEVIACEPIKYQATVAWPGLPNAPFSGGTITITTPDGVPHDVTGGTGTVPCIGGTYNGPDPVLDQCLGAPTSYTSQQVSFTATVADCATTPTLEASATYEGAVFHIQDNNLPGGSATVHLGIPCKAGRLRPPGSGLCCQKDICGSACCDELERCVNPARGTCCSFAVSDCNGVCCPGQDACIDGQCCPTGRACGSSRSKGGRTCCAEGSVCVNGTCETCREGQFACATESGNLCCPSGISCCAPDGVPTCCGTSAEICCGPGDSCMDANECVK